jgi:hypothetical protein
VSLREAARQLGVHYSTVSRVRAAMPGATVLQPDPQHVAAPELADGFYQVSGGVPYRIQARPGDEFHVDESGQLVPGRLSRRSVQVRAEP